MAGYSIDNNFKYHPPNELQVAWHGALRDTGKELAQSILDLCPDSRERSLALTKVEEAVMWANAAIARNM